ncbi:MAG TPA: hypothetical protein VFX98_06515 [Longimicrobiaceae bacterium]|nr:hypothetical protein [Longimicrobiaceae bacterium]
MLLIAGGELDPNVESLAGRMKERGIEGVEVRVGPNRHPCVTWDMEADTLRVDGEELRPTSAFIRYDVFANMADPRQATSYRAQAWHTTLQGWALAHDVRVMNRDYLGQTNKPFMLRLARECGLPIPRTLITNDLERLDRLAEGEALIAKPVPGGGYTQELTTLLAGTPRKEGKAAAPAIVQQKLVQPEVRLYGIGTAFIPFAVKSQALDYRNASDTSVEHLPLESIDPRLVAGLGRLMEALQMQYAAADFKTDPETGELRFLEVNSGPMFAAFDQASDGAVSHAILDWLTGEG